MARRALDVEAIEMRGSAEDDNMEQVTVAGRAKKSGGARGRSRDGGEPDAAVYGP